jgi:hypothetical protein
MSCVGRIARMEDVYKIFVGKPEGKKEITRKTLEFVGR